MEPQTIVTVSDQPALEQSSESEIVTELAEDVATVADEILVEVKLCREREERLIADLALLREESATSKSERETLLREIQNLREESRNLQAELKALLETNQSQPSESLTPSISQVIVEEPEIINPASSENIPEEPVKKKKRYRI